MAAGRVCPICGGGNSKADAFPYAIRFVEQVFRYRKCNSCRSVFVDPLPDEAAFSQMYEKSTYHDLYYADGVASRGYVDSVEILARFAPAGCSVLDYGCGAGGFLKACKSKGFEAIGVEFDQAAAREVTRAISCRAMTVDEFLRECPSIEVDVVHLGDVLEHLPDPFGSLKAVLACPRPGGLLYVEGPLEVNPSPVYYAAWAFGALKKRVLRGRIGAGVPTHLFRTHAVGQRLFFSRIGPGYELIYWDVTESGWPYAGGWINKALHLLDRSNRRWCFYWVRNLWKSFSSGDRSPMTEKISMGLVS